MGRYFREITTLSGILAALDYIYYSLRSMDGKVNVKMTEFPEGHPSAYVQNFDAKDLVVAANVNKKSVFKFKGFFDFANWLKLNVQGIGLFIKRYIHLCLLEPIGCNDNEFPIEFLVDHFQNPPIKGFLANLPAGKTWQQVFRMKNSIFNLILGKLSLVNPDLAMFSVNNIHYRNNNRLLTESQENPQQL